MATYRVYRLDAAGRITGPPDVLDCGDDAQAIRAAHGVVPPGVTAEIWQMSRIVARIVGTGRRAAD
jgi:hypothetical protein